MNEAPPLTLKEYYEKHTEVMVSLNGLTKSNEEIIKKQDLMSERVARSESRIDTNEKNISNLQNEMRSGFEKMTTEIKNVNTQSVERWNLSQDGIKSAYKTIEEYKAQGDNKTTRIENNKTFLWRWAFVVIIGFVFTVIGAILAKTGILNLK